MRAHRTRVAFALGLGLLVCRAASAQYRYDTWTTDNGLPQNGIRASAQTPDGYLWFTTFDGLVRFDGVQFTTFGSGNTQGIKAADAALYRAKARGRNRIESA